MAVFWVLAPCSLVEIYQRFRGPCCLHHQGDDYSSETLVNFYQTTRRYNPEDSHLRTNRRENIKSYMSCVCLPESSYLSTVPRIRMTHAKYFEVSYEDAEEINPCSWRSYYASFITEFGRVTYFLIVVMCLYCILDLIDTVGTNVLF
jgi:hypothetical protein